MRVFISCDIEGVNGICSWDETEYSHPRYFEFQKQMTEEVNRACQGARMAGAKYILVKDAHDSAKNILISNLPEYITLHRGWDGSICTMMGGLTRDFDAVIFIGYHSPSRSDGNSLSHTMNTKIHHVKINDVIASEFIINAYYASYLNIPIAFLSGDLNLTTIVKDINSNIEVVATKQGHGGAAISPHPILTNREIEEKVFSSLSKDLSNNKISLPDSFKIEVEYKKHTDAYFASFFPGCKLLDSDKIIFESTDYYEVLRCFKFIL